MSGTDAFETGIISLLFNNTNYANVGDSTGLRGSTAAGVFYISLHTADPGEVGTQATSETAYTNYARQAVVRTVVGWTIADNVASNAAVIDWPTCGVTGSTVTHFGIGTDATGAGNLIFKGTATVPAISAGITPSAAIGAITTTGD
jgi:hypothetical protein